MYGALSYYLEGVSVGRGMKLEDIPVQAIEALERRSHRLGLCPIWPEGLKAFMLGSCGRRAARHLPCAIAYSERRAMACVTCCVRVERELRQYLSFVLAKQVLLY